MSSIGVMAMPADFRYREVFLKGKPQHDRFDLFRVRHPSMDVGRRAKIFSPFDALKGFNEAIASKDVLYRDRIELSEDDRKELDRRLQILKGLTYNGRMARANRVKVTVVYYGVDIWAGELILELRKKHRDIRIERERRHRECTLWRL